MLTDNEISQIAATISQSKKYRHINPWTVEKVVRELSENHNSKELEKKAKQRLHLMWGAYFNRPKFAKLKQKIDIAADSETGLEALNKEFLMLQSSTKERLEILDGFYGKIWEITGKPNSVMELGCGANALTYKWMGDIKYEGYDIDIEFAQFCNYFFEKAGYSKAETLVADAFEVFPGKYDVVILLKLVMLLEKQEQGSVEKILKSIDTKYFVISYPLGTLSNKNVGMLENYQKQFGILANNCNFKKINEIQFANELVYVVEK